MGPPNIASVDVEDYFHVEAFARVIDRAQWSEYTPRVEANTRRLLDLFDESGVHGTFFILGWVAERFPALVREIVARGHEPACHSYWHRLIYTLSPDEFRQDTGRAKSVIEDACGQPVTGYRAPSFSITRRSRWALEILVESGFKYDSSVFPVTHDVYGVPDAPRGPFIVDTPSGPILEYPMTTFRIALGRNAAGPNLPVAGGGYLRMLPAWYTRWGAGRAWQEGLPLISYVHPWEIDPGQPRIAAPLKSRLRHYTNLGKTEDRLRQLFGLGEFGPFDGSSIGARAQSYDFLPADQALA
jgi:polysaccharide deacetylase family protein (PEP-CTERM system associated)